MEWVYDHTFRFFDLPPELRNMIYKCYLEDHHEYQLDISQWQRFAPYPAVLAVSRQMHSEFVGFYKAALSDFFTNHFWYCPLTASLREDDVRNSVLSTIHAIPKTASIREIQFSATSFKYNPRRWPIALIISVTVDVDGKVQWTFRALNRPPWTPIFFIQAWLNKLEERKKAYGVTLTQGSADLNVGNCIQVMMGKFYTDDDHFDELAVFFQN